MTMQSVRRPAARRAGYAPPDRLRRRFRNTLRTIFTRGDISSLLMTWALMIITALALRAAAWTAGLGALVGISFLSVWFGFLLARSHYPELLALTMSSVYSIAAVLVVSAMALHDGPILARTDALLLDLKIWLSDVINNKPPAHDDAAFVVSISVLFWFLGHNAAWHVFRIDRVWRVIIPTGLVLVTNEFYYQGDRSLDGYLAAFVIVSLLLLIRSHIDNREYDWFVHRVSFPNYVRRAFFQAGGVLALVLVLAAWIAPTGSDDRSLERVKNFLSGDAFVQLADLWNRLFSSLETSGIATSDYYGGDELQLTGAIQLGDQPVMIVEAPEGPRYYWRSTVYDAYDFSTWRWKHIRTVRAFTDDPGLQFNIGATFDGARRDVSQTFTMLLSASDLVYAAPQPVEVGLPVEAELDCVNDFGRGCINNNQPSDVAVIQTRKTLRSGDSYTVTSSISVASASLLRSAGQDYPDWVLRLYLQGATSVSPRVSQLAAQIIAQDGAQTPYDKAKAIERWLRTYIQYNESIPAPPRGSDPIEWFLFDERQGYCNYYASAMVLMLRSQGIPARMAAGFAQGTYEADRGVYLVRERDAHTWVEVYFPGYGWVEFEPTADEAPLDRQDELLPQTVLPTVTPVPTPTPLPTLTPTPLLATPEGGANATPTSAAQEPFLPSTPTPTPTPMPTATPIPPLANERIGGGGGGILRVVLLTLGIFALVMLSGVLVILFTIWYVEYRGLGGLNIVERAYARMAIYARWLGIPLAQSATPDERRRSMIDELPDGEKPISAITHAYIRNRYGEPTDRDERIRDSHIAHGAWQEARKTFIRRKLAQFFGRR
jgi:transglutaminase-like putative cysteine protease